MPLYTIAGFTFDICSPSERLMSLCRNYEAKEGVAPDYTIALTAEDLDNVRRRDPRITAFSAEISATYEKICTQLLDRDAIFLHAAVIELDGKAYAFSAPPGTGKSTHISLWKKAFGDRVRILNGDKPILRFENDTIYAYGTPFCGKEHWNTNAKAPLGGLCFLSRGKTDGIHPISPVEALPSLFHQVFLGGDTAAAMKTMELCDRLLRTVPLYALTCTPTLNAARVACEAMTKKE